MNHKGNEELKLLCNKKYITKTNWKMDFFFLASNISIMDNPIENRDHNFSTFYHYD
jgi:hypothetical protein